MIIIKNVYSIMTSGDEDKVFDACNGLIENIMTAMKENDCDELMSSTTGELITYNDLCRMRGILEGLPIMTIMYKAE